MKEFEKWFKKAENDLIAVKNLISLSDAPFDICCFHAQQAAEKYLKAYLVARNIDFPKTHDLVKLLIICKQKDANFSALEIQCDNLTDYGITHRYPDDMDELTYEDAQLAYQNSLTIKEFVTTHFFD
jgi:HEPN domain-containing protein